MFRRSVIALCLCLAAMTANADTLRVVIEGELSALGSDAYGLDGASFRGSYVYDVVSGPQGDNCFDFVGFEYGCTWPMVYAHVDFSDRPAGLADIGTDLGGLSLTATHVGGVTQDSYQSFSGAFPAAMFGAYSGTISVSNRLYLDTVSGSVTPWSYAFLTDPNPMAVAMGGNVLTGSSATYAITSPSLAEVSIIPIPPAVWLFGSALGVMGWMRRKAHTKSVSSHYPASCSSFRSVCE